MGEYGVWRTAPDDKNLTRMASNPLDLAAPGVRGLKPYQPGKPLEELEREYGVREAVKLASNENPLGPSPAALAALRGLEGGLARYPDGNAFGLKQALSRHLEVDAAQITLGNGSNDVLELIARAFLTPADEAVFSEFAFAVYPLAIQAIGARAVMTPSRDWGHDLEAMQAALTERTRLVFIANPNNPTGTWLEAAALEAFLAAVPSHVIVVVDEAYHEYAAAPATGAEGYASLLDRVERHPNLIVTRTFSKAYGLAGLRVGYAVSSPAVADLLNRVRQPFNVNSLAQAAAVAALEDAEHIARSVALNAEGLRLLGEGLVWLDLRWIPSAGNFLSVDVGENAPGVYEALLRQGVIVRPVSGYGMPRHLRVTVGTAEQNRRLLAALESALQQTMAQD